MTARDGALLAVSTASASAKEKKKRHVCPQCHRAFARSGHLIRHERSHTKEKPFECDSCQSSFGRRDLLLRHNRTVHSKDNAANNGAQSVATTTKKRRKAAGTDKGGSRVRMSTAASDNIIAVSPVRLHVESSELDMLQWDNFQH